MIKTIKRPISILLAVLMVIGMFSALPISAGATNPVDYYVVGTMNSWAISEDYKMVLNENNTSEYWIQNVPLHSGDQIKVVSSTDGSTVQYWYPDGTDNNLAISEDGYYDVYVAPAGHNTWHYNCILATKQSDLNYVAQIDSTKYETLQAAIDAAQTGDAITLLDDIALTGEKWFVVDNKDLTIDLGGKNISSEDSVFVLKNGADLTVKNGTMTTSVSGDYAIYVNNESVFTLNNDATLKATNSNGNGIIVRDGGKAVINGTVESGYYSIAGFGSAVVDVNAGASITSTNASALSGNGSSGNEGYTFNINGGTLTSVNDVAIYHPNQGTLNIIGGTITGATAIYVKSGTTDISTSTTSISGATITGNGAAKELVHSGNGCNPTGDAIVIENCGYPGGTPAIDISGGTIVSNNADPVHSYGYNDYEPIEKFVSGGTFSKPVPAAYCADGYDPKDNGDGTYTVTPKDYVAQVGSTKYETFEEAVTAANGTEVITLLADGPAYVMTGGETLKVNKNGFKFSNPKVEGAYLVNSATADGVTTYTTEEASVKYTNANGAVTYYKTISSVNNGTYQLLKDITTTSYIIPGTFASDVTIDLNGHTFTSSNARSGYETAVLLSRDGKESAHKKFTIQNGKIVYTNANSPLSAITVSGKYNDVTIENVTIESAVCGIQVTGENQTVAISDSSITGTNDFALATNGSATKNATITVEDSTLTSDGSIGVYLPGDADVTFTDSNVSGTTAMYIKGGNVTVDGGTITANGAAAEFSHNGNGANATGDAIVVESCNYPAGVPTLNISGAPTVTSANGVQVGDYTYGSAADPEVTATTNTLTLPEGQAWVPTETEGVYTIGAEWEAEFSAPTYTYDWSSTNKTIYVTIKHNGVALTTEEEYTEVKDLWEVSYGTEGVVTPKSVLPATGKMNIGFKPKAGGTTTVTFSLKSDPTVKAEATITINDVVTGITFEKDTLVQNGANKIVGLKVNGAAVDPADYEFTTENTDIATVDGLNITPVTTGTATLAISKNGQPIGTRNAIFTDNAVAKSGDEYYSSLLSAFNKAADGSTVTVLEDITVTSPVSYSNGKDVTLDLNGKTISSTNATAIISVSNGSLTVKDSDGNGKIANTKGYDFFVTNGSDLTIESGTYEAVTSIVQTGDKTKTGGNVEITGGNFVAVADTNEATDANGNVKYALNMYDTQRDTSSFTVTGGTFTKFDPADNSSEGEHINYVPAGYQSVKSGDTYTVKPADLFAGYSVSVGGTITMNVYINSEAIPGFGEANNNASATFTWDTAEVTHGKQYGNDTYTVNLSPANVDGNGYIRASVPVNAAQMANTITATVTVNDDTLDEIGTFSVKEYGETIIADGSQPETVKTLVKEMLNYGAMAQKVFVNQLEDKPDELANAGLSEDDLDAIETEMNNVTSAKIIGAVKDANGGKRGATVEQLRAIGTAIGGKWYTTSVIFLDGNTIRHYFDDVNEGVMNHAGAAGVQDTWFYYVEKKDIAASQLDTLYTFTIGGQSFQYSVLDYAAAVLESNMGDDAENLAKALYLYNQAANACFSN